MSGRLPWALVVVIGLATPAAAQRAVDPFAEADALFAQARYRDAAAAYEAALARDPAPAEPHFYLANAYDNLFVPEKRGDPGNDRLLEAAREHYHLAARLLVRPDQATLRLRALQFLAHLYGPDRLDRPDDARAALEEVLTVDPGTVAAYFDLARLHDCAGRPGDAEAVVALAQSARPDSVEVWTATAAFLDCRGDVDGTLAALRRLAEIEPADAAHPYALAVHLEARVRKTVNLPPDRAREYLRLGLEAVDSGLGNPARLLRGADLQEPAAPARGPVRGRPAAAADAGGRSGPAAAAGDREPEPAGRPSPPAIDARSRVTPDAPTLAAR